MNSSTNKVAVATTSQLAADAAREIAELGGNAVDCGIAAAMCSINTQPGVCALAGSAFVTLWLPDAEPLTIDGNVAVPGKGRCDPAPRAERVAMEYGGGIETLVGASSVAVPGTLAALYLASERYGRIAWRDVMAPSVRAAREGFPLATACHYYLGYAGDVIYGRSADGHSALHYPDGSLRAAGSKIVVPHLADCLDTIAREGQSAFYGGDVGQQIAEHVQANGGLLTMDDLTSYEPAVHPALRVDMGEWQIATNPPPAIGGVNLAAMLHCFGTDSLLQWDDDALLRLIQSQAAVMRYRQSHLDTADDIEEPARRMLELASTDLLLSKWASGSTVHTSAVDDQGAACAVTASSGYGSGEIAPGTGIWLNNCLGELELNRHGLDASPPGRRLPSNMAPGCARSGTSVLALGSPGADRITTALHQFLVNFVQLGLELDEAVAHPRLHLKIDESGDELAVEPGIELPDLDIDVRHYDALSMYFGGVVATLYSQDEGFVAAADPRREGGTYIGPELP